MKDVIDYNKLVGKYVKVNNHFEKVTNVELLPQYPNRSSKPIPVAFSGDHMIEEHMIDEIFEDVAE
jgi:hypothetical protein